jgi:hypothetical protein
VKSAWSGIARRLEDALPLLTALALLLSQALPAASAEFPACSP